MKLKKIYPPLLERLQSLENFEPSEMLLEVFGTLKSGADVFIAAPTGAGKTFASVLHILQRLQKPEGESPRALVLVPDNQRGEEWKAVFDHLNTNQQLRLYWSKDKTDIDEDKNLISLGIDVLLGSPNRINQLFAGAGFDANRLLIWCLDDADELVKMRTEQVILRLNESINKPQRVVWTSTFSERLYVLVDKITTEVLEFDFEDFED